MLGELDTLHTWKTLLPDESTTGPGLTMSKMDFIESLVPTIAPTLNVNVFLL